MTEAFHSTPLAALQASQLCVSLDGVEVLHGVNLSVVAGRWTCVVGPNGAGKSTLLKALAGLLPLMSGEVRLHGQPIPVLPGRDRARKLSWLGQGESGADDLTAYDVAMLGRLPHQGWLASPSPTDHGVVESALRSTQAWDWRDRPLGHLSGGERQRVLLARALAVEAEVMLMDEPLANLDPPHQADWLALVQGLVAGGKTVVSVLHEINMALHSEDLVLMQGGRIVHAGCSADPATHRAMEQVFDHRLRVVAVEDEWVVLPRHPQRESE